MEAELGLQDGANDTSARIILDITMITWNDFREHSLFCMHLTGDIRGDGPGERAGVKGGWLSTKALLYVAGKGAMEWHLEGVLKFCKLDCTRYCHVGFLGSIHILLGIVFYDHTLFFLLILCLFYFYFYFFLYILNSV